MGSNKLKLNKKLIFQICLIFLGIIIIFFTYFYKGNEEKIAKTLPEAKKNTLSQDENKKISTFEDVQYEGLDKNGNKFIINSDFAEFESDKSNLIYMKQVFCRFFFKDGTVLKIVSDKGIYDNISNDMEFEDNVEMYYLENELYSDKANFVNSENYFIVQGNVIGEGPLGNVAADKLNVDLIQKKMKISMYNESNLNIKVNY